jgi:hypothetical protein
MKTKIVDSKVQLKGLKIGHIKIPIKGTSPLIVHAWSKNAVDALEASHMGLPKNAKHEILVIETAYQEAKHISNDGWEGFPAVGFKASMVRAGKMIGMVMKDIQSAFFVIADDPISQLVRIIPGVSECRRDIVRLSNGSPDLRYRPIYKEWSAVLDIEFNQGVLSLDEIHQLVMAAGYGSGIGEMRPEKTKYAYGRWEIDSK